MFRYSAPFRLSDAGSTRATSYAFSNKSITLDGKTHVCWLDAIAEVRARTYDHATKTWGPTQHVGTGSDNHTSPAFTLGRDRHLRVTYGPHCWDTNWNQSRFKHQRATQPNSIDAWENAQDFGYDATYASVTHTPWDCDAIGYRGGEEPMPAMFQLQKADGAWTTAKAIFHQNIPPQYTHTGSTLICGGDGTLYYGAHFYNSGTHLKPVEGLSYGVTVVRSTDRGLTWTDMAGRAVVTPALYDDRFAVPPFGRYVYMCGLAVDSRGSLWALTNQPSPESREIWLSRWSGAKWETTDVSTSLPAGLVAVDTTMMIDTRDRIHVVCTTQPMSQVAGLSLETAWGHPSCEVFHLCSADAGKSWHCKQVSTPDPASANWLPNVTRPGVFHPVERPTILYTHGVPGVGCAPTTTTEAYCVMLDEA
ncbi:MAG: glycoside hydrolase [Planctomycetes bacterium]|nr:glycoside hydrolase [Planctomycetota bacterium]